MPVYLIRAGAFGDVKIGVANDPLARLNQLQTSMPIKLRLVRVLAGEQAEERSLHSRFASTRKAGEWFGFQPGMMGDLGLEELSIPRPKRAWGGHDTQTAKGRFDQMVEDLFEVAGGKDAFARAIGIAPWIVQSTINALHLSALTLLARQHGAPVTFRQVLILSEAMEEEKRRADAASSSGISTVERNAETERNWIIQHGTAAVWWDRYTEDAPTPTHADAAA